MKGHMQDGKFHPHTQYKKGVRMSRDQQEKTQGIKVNERKQRQVMASQLEGMSQAKKAEWEDAVGSEVVKVKKEMINGKPVTSVRFENGEEWFEFDDVKHQEDYMKKEKIEVDESVVGEFVEIEHPDIAGYITMATGKVLFGEREERKARELPTNKKLIDKLKNKKGVSAKVERLEEDDDEGTAFVDRVVVNITKEKTFDSIGNGATAREIATKATGLTEDELDSTMMTNGLSELEDEGKVKFKNGKWVKA